MQIAAELSSQAMSMTSMTVPALPRLVSIVCAAAIGCGGREPAQESAPESAHGAPAAARADSVTRVAVRADCGLLGRWDLTLARGRRRHARGTIVFTDSAGPRAPSGTPYRTLPTWRGSYAVSLDSLFGKGEGGVESTSRSDPPPGEAAAPVHAVLSPADSVDLVFEPYVSHGPLSLAGVRRADSITGRWRQRTGAPPPMPGEPNPTPRGTFTLARAAGCGAQ